MGWGLGSLLWLQAATRIDPVPDPDSSQVSPVVEKPTKQDSPHLANLIQVSDSVYSGGTPDGAEGFAELKKLGIRTIISVDGAKPNVDLAQKSGLRYGHIPIGYSGIPDQQKATLASVFDECPPPYYFHCHHGKHRGPAALASGLILTGKMSASEATQFLKLAGTSKHYDGLWKAVAQTSKRMNLPAPLPLKSVTQVSSMASAMAEIDEIYDYLKDLKKRDWKPDPTKPDVTPTHQSLMLLELLKEIPRTSDEEQLKDPLFAKYLKANTLHAKELEHALRKDDFAAANKALKQLKSSCIDCHSDYRD